MTIICELKKALIKKRGLILIILFLIINCILTITHNDTSEINNVVEQNKDSYYYYLNTLNGKLDSKKEEFIKSSQNDISVAEENNNNAFNALISGKISDNEYFSITNQGNNVLNKQNAFGAISGQYLKIKENPEIRYFIYENGWKLFLAKENSDLLMVILILIIITPVFCFEEERGMSRILKTSKYGKSNLFFSKFILIIIIATGILCLFFLSDYIIYNIKYGLSDGNFPLQSLTEFSNSKYNISIMQMVFIYFINKFIGIVYISSIVIVLSAFIKKSYFTVFSSFSLIYIPYFLFSDSSLKYLIPTPVSLFLSTRFFKGKQLEQMGIKSIEELSKESYLIVLCVSIVIIGILIVLAYIKYCGIKVKVKKVTGKTTCFALISCLVLSLCSCSTDKFNDISNFVFNSSVGDYYLYNNNILIDNTALGSNTIKEINSKKEYPLIRNAFFDAKNSPIISNVRLTDNSIYYMQSGTNSNFKIIKIDISTFTEKTIYEKIDYVSANSNFLGIGKNDSFSGNNIKSNAINYFVVSNYLFISKEGKLFKINLSNNTTEILLEDNIYQISYYNNFIYYINGSNQISSYDLKTKTIRKLTNNMSNYLLVSRNGIYYTNLSDKGKIYRMDYTGDNDLKFLDTKCKSINFNEDYIYLSDVENKMSLYRVNYDGTNIKKLTDKPAYFIYSFDNYDKIFYMTDGGSKDNSSSVIFESISK